MSFFCRVSKIGNDIPYHIFHIPRHPHCVSLHPWGSSETLVSTSWVLPRLDRIHPLCILFSWGGCWCSSSYKWIYKQWDFQDLTMELLYHSHILWLYSLTLPFRVPKMNIDITIVRGIMNIANPNLWRLPP